MSQRTQFQNDLATFHAYIRFCRQYPAYRHSMSNQIRVFEWLDDRRIEMLAEGRPHWIPATQDFERAVRDCADDLVQPAHPSRSK